MPKDGLERITLVITKASLQPDGTIRWQAVASDTTTDNYGERTSLTLFRNWIERAEKGIGVAWLPAPHRPFLGVSHYPSLDGFGEAGVTLRMFVDGDRFKADGHFLDTPIGQALYQAVRGELDLIKRGEAVAEPIRISAAWWDLQHSHGSFTFTRKSLHDVCPMCAAGVGDKQYLDGQLDHLASTRVPVNPRTALELEEKSMSKKTRRSDAASIVGEELAGELEVRTRQLVGKSEADEEPEALVVRSEGEEAMIKKQGDKWVLFSHDGKKKLGEFDSEEAAQKRERQIQFFKHQKSDVAQPEGDVAAFTIDEMGEICPDCAQAMVELGMTSVDLTEKAGNMEALSRHIAKKIGADPGFFTKCTNDAEVKGICAKGGYDVKAFCARAHKIAVGKWPTQKADVEKDGIASPIPVTIEPPVYRPFGGATSVQEAEDYMKAKELSHQLFSNWDMFNAVIENILSLPDGELDKLAAVRTAVSEFGDRVGALKATLSDAYLVYPVKGGVDMTGQVQTAPGAQPVPAQAQPANPAGGLGSDPALLLKAAVDAAMANPALVRAGKLEAIQSALESYVGAVKAQVDLVAPPAPGEAIAAAIEKSMGPIAEKLDLLLQKMGAPAIQAAQPVPQQKSARPGPAGALAVTQSAAQSGLPVSPVTGKPSALTARIRRSVGIVE